MLYNLIGSWKEGKIFFLFYFTVVREWFRSWNENRMRRKFSRPNLKLSKEKRRELELFFMTNNVENEWNREKNSISLNKDEERFEITHKKILKWKILVFQHQQTTTTIGKWNEWRSKESFTMFEIFVDTQNTEQRRWWWWWCYEWKNERWKSKSRENWIFHFN